MKRASLKQYLSGKKYEITLHYDQWLHPNSTERKQIKVGPVSSEELLKEYGDFLYDGAYTTGFTTDGSPKVDVWATATDERIYKYPFLTNSETEMEL